MDDFMGGGTILIRIYLLFCPGESEVAYHSLYK